MTAKDLKNALLQEAVQGKLVPQIASEGNAKDLLEEIKKEKAKLIKEGKVKKDTTKAGASGRALPEIGEDEIPFEIPESWCWCRLGELGTFVRGNGIKRSETIEKGFPCVRYGEMYTTYKIKFSTTKSFTSKDIFDKSQKVHKDDILMALTGENKWDIALAATYQGESEIAIGGDLCKFSPIHCYSLFLVYIINSPFGIEYKRNTATGDIIVHISVDKLGNMIFPLPPLVEQKRIVAALEKFMPLVEDYGKKESELRVLNNSIPKQLKNAILQEAVQGKLTEGWRKSQSKLENAHDLLEEIKRGCHTDSSRLTSSQKKKSLTPITEDEIPFEIPESWCWCRIDDIFAHNSGKALNKTGNKEGIELEYITTSNLYWNYFELNNLKTMLFKDSEIEKCTVLKGDLLICEGGEVGRSAIWNYDRTICIQNHIHRLRAYDSKLNVLFYYHVMYLFKESKIIDNYAKGIGIKGLSSNALGSIVVPLPPLAEQKKVVEMIEQMLPLCEKLGG